MNGAIYGLIGSWISAIMICYFIEVIFAREMLDRDGDFVDIGEEPVHSYPGAELFLDGFGVRKQEDGMFGFSGEIILFLNGYYDC